MKLQKQGLLSMNERDRIILQKIKNYAVQAMEFKGCETELFTIMRECNKT